MTPADNKLLSKLLTILLIVLLFQVVLGGITRLTGSGLSITEWRVITGTIPPLNEQDWQTEFNKYKNTPQFEKLNQHFTISDFKFIYFWEWAHRVWGRLGFILLLSVFGFFAIRKKLNSQSLKHFGVLLFLYLCQGLIGWVMVASGLKNNPYVSHYRLTFHLLMAIVLLAYILWIIVFLYLQNNQQITSSKLRKWANLLIVFLVVQIIFGAFMSGLRAAPHYPTFPLMNGQIIPDNLFLKQPIWVNFGENITTIQFVHRGLPLIILIISTLFFYNAIPVLTKNTWFNIGVKLLPVLLICQICLGITTLMLSRYGIPVGFGAAHQCFGILLLGNALFLRYLLKK